MSTESALLSVAGRLDNLLLAEAAPAKCEGDLRNEVVKLRSKLDRIEQSLKADATENISEDVKQDVTQLAYDIEDAVEFYARRRVQEASSGKSLKDSFRRFLKSCSTSLQDDLHNFNEKIDKLKQRLPTGAERDDAAAAAAGEGESSGSRGTSLSNIVEPQSHWQQVRDNRTPPSIVGSAAAAEGESSSSRGTSLSNIVKPQPHWQQVRDNRTPPPFIVGRVDDAKYLSDFLLQGDPELSAMAICGMNGIGKTTLAKLIYNDPSVVNHFDNRAWAIVRGQYKARSSLETILSCLTPDRSKDEIERMGTLELTEKLYKAQKGRRYLVVLDDVWSPGTWNTLRFAFPDDHNGSRVIITTRDREVATDLKGAAHPLSLSLLSKDHSWKMLSEDHSWKIFKMKSGLKDQEIEKIGWQIVNYCQGLPLAITIMGGSLRGKNLEDWKMMLQRLEGNRNSERLPEEAYYSELIYNHLPFHLKPLFLYLGQFPEDEAIRVEKLYLLWIAEGLIPMRALNNKAQMEVAEDYFNELVDRSLVIPVEKEEVSASRSFKSWEVHDLIRDLCRWKGRKEKFFTVIPLTRPFSTRRLAIYLNMSEDTTDVVSNTSEAKNTNIRSILFFDRDAYLPKPTWPREVSDLSEFQQTRVLDFDGVDFRVKKRPMGIEKLTYLRHLSFTGCYLQEFPSSFSNFPFLEILDLRVTVSCIMTIPNVLRKLSSLRHLYFPLAFQSESKDKLRLDSLKMLEVLENFHAGICDAEDLLQLENLQILTGTVDGNNLDLKNSIKSIKMKSVRRSSLVVKKFDSYSEERRSLVEELLRCTSLHGLEIQGYLGLSLFNKASIGQNFTEMIFNGSRFTEDPMRTLGELPNLRSLVLCNDAFVGKKMVCSGFPQLTSLKLAKLQHLETLEVAEGAMPNLTIFTIEQCDKLECPVVVGSMSPKDSFKTFG